MFELHPRLAADSYFLADWPLCRVLLAKDCRYPWLILVPRRAGIREIHELVEADRQQLWAESCTTGEWMTRLFKADKLNLAALGNQVSQLHLHHIARYQTDDSWPHPIWGKHPTLPYTEQALADRCALLRPMLEVYPEIPSE